MSVWVYIIGAVISLNCLLAWASQSHGAKCLAMWIGCSYGLGLVLTLTGRLLFPGAALLNFPWQNVLAGVTDLGLLMWLLAIINRNDDLKRHWKTLAFAQVGSLCMHALDVATGHHFKGLYYGALDAILLSLIVVNIALSANHGISASVLFPGITRANRHRHRTG